MLGLTKVIVGGCAAALLIGGGLAGCGASQHGGTSQRGVAPSRVSCGSATARFLDDRTELLSAKPGALPCFDAAARNCRSASISVTTMGVDAGTRYTFAIEPGTGSCQVTEQSQFYLVSGGLRHGPVTTTHCRIGAATAKSVTLSCSGGDILIPATVSHSGAVS
jgi:hypothetical protein